MDFKMWVLSGHYQGARNFTFESLAAAKARRLNWRNRIAECYQSKIKSEGAFDKILEAVGNNLGSPEAFALIDTSSLSLDDWRKVDELFGLRLIADSPDIDEDTRAVISDRQVARERKDYAESDRVRDILAERGISVKDTPDGSIWQYI